MSKNYMYFNVKCKEHPQVGVGTSKGEDGPSLDNHLLVAYILISIMKICWGIYLAEGNSLDNEELRENVFNTCMYNSRWKWLRGTKIIYEIHVGREEVSLGELLTWGAQCGFEGGARATRASKATGARTLGKGMWSLLKPRGAPSKYEPSCVGSDPRCVSIISCSCLQLFLTSLLILSSITLF